MRKSVSRSAWVAPTIVASSPMHRCRKPPIFAFAYISPARSSKRRMSIIFESTVRQVSGSGRSCLTSPNRISSALATSPGARPSPLPSFVVSRVATFVGEYPVGFANNLCAGPPGYSSGGSSFQRGGSILQAVIAPEQLIADQQRWNTAYAALVRLACGLAQPVLGRLHFDALQHGGRMQLTGGCGDQHVVDIRKIPAGRERLPKRRQRVSDGAAGLLREDRGAHRPERVVRPAIRPLDRHQLVLCRPALDLRHAFLALIGRPPRPSARLLPDPPEEDRLPDGDDWEDVLDPLGGEIGVRGAHVVVKGRLLCRGHGTGTLLGGQG